MGLHFPWKGNNIHLNFFIQNFIVADNSNESIDKNIPEKGPLNFIVGSLTSFLLFIFFYFLSNKIAIYFSVHKPSNSSEIVQNISSSINTLIIGLSFLLTFSFAFIGIGLFIVFIRSFFLKKNWIANIIKKTLSLNVFTWLRPFSPFAVTWNDFINITTYNLRWRRLNYLKW